MLLCLVVLYNYIWLVFEHFKVFWLLIIYLLMLHLESSISLNASCTKNWKISINIITLYKVGIKMFYLWLINNMVERS